MLNANIHEHFSGYGLTKCTLWSVFCLDSNTDKQKLQTKDNIEMLYKMPKEPLSFTAISSIPTKRQHYWFFFSFDVDLEDAILRLEVLIIKRTVSRSIPLTNPKMPPATFWKRKK